MRLICPALRSPSNFRDGKPALVVMLDHVFVDDKKGKPVGNNHFIGRHLVMALGNSNGDKAVMNTTIGNSRPSDSRTHFDPVFAAKSTGPGMGLSICWRIKARAHAGGGAIFSFSLPVANGEGM